MRRIAVETAGKEVVLGASGNTPILYMTMTGRDLNKDISQIYKTVQASGIDTESEVFEGIPFTIEELVIFSNIAYVMAYQASEDRKHFPKTCDEWLDELDAVFSVYTLLPTVFELWGLNQEQTVEAKKNLVRRQGR